MDELGQPITNTGGPQEPLGRDSLFGTSPMAGDQAPVEIGDDSVVNTPADDASPDPDADLDPDDAP